MATAQRFAWADPVAEDGDPSAPRLTAGSLSSVAALGATVLCAAITTPVILHTLGARTYGVWVLLTVVGGYTQLADFGVAFAVSRFVGEHRARRQPTEIAAFLGSAALLYALISIAVLLTSAGLGVAIPWLTGIPGSERAAFLVAAVLVGAATALALWLAFFLNVLHAYQRLPLANLVRAGYWVLLAPASIAVVLLGWGIEGLAAAMIVATVLACAGALVTLRAAIPGLTVGRPQRRHVREALSYGAFLFAIAASGTIIFETSNVLIAGTLGVVAVAAYAVALRLTRTLSQALHKVSDALFPFYAGMRASGDLPRLREHFLKAARLELAGAAAVALGLIFGGSAVLRLWVGRDNVLIDSAFALAVALVLLDGLAYPAGVLATAIGGERRAALANLTQAGLNIALAVMLVGRYGVTGVLAAAVLAQAVTSLWVMPRWAIRSLRISWLEYLEATVGPVALSLIPGAIAGWVVLRAWNAPWAAVMVALLVYGAASVGLRRRRGSWRP